MKKIVAEEYSFSRDALPKSLSYPLKRSLLDDALRTASLYRAVWYVVYSRHSFERVVLQAWFSPDETAPRWSSGRINLTVRAVPAVKRKVIEDALLAEGIPQLCRWMTEAESMGDGWRSLPHSFTVEYGGTSLNISKE